jgi:hypothetical protein
VKSRPSLVLKIYSTLTVVGRFVVGGVPALDADLIVRSNSRYSISVFSQNGSIMRNADPEDASKVPYRFSSNGQIFTLPQATAQPIVSRAAPTTTADSRSLISVIVGEVDWVTEGSYRDVDLPGCGELETEGIGGRVLCRIQRVHARPDQPGGRRSELDARAIAAWREANRNHDSAVFVWFMLFQAAVVLQYPSCYNGNHTDSK